MQYQKIMYKNKKKRKRSVYVRLYDILKINILNDNNYNYLMYQKE